MHKRHPDKGLTRSTALRDPAVTADMGQRQQGEGFMEEGGWKRALGMDTRGVRRGDSEDFIAWGSCQEYPFPIACHYQLGNSLRSLEKGSDAWFLL